MAGQLGVTSTPILAVADLGEATAFYEQAGFGVQVHTDEEGQPGGFAFVDFDEQSVFDLDVVDIDPTRNAGGCYLVVAEAATGMPAWRPPVCQRHRSLTNRGACGSTP
jgi:hypothetical protein